jgi:hypothetical protein
LDFRSIGAIIGLYFSQNSASALEEGKFNRAPSQAVLRLSRLVRRVSLVPEFLFELIANLPRILLEPGFLAFLEVEHDADKPRWSCRPGLASPTRLQVRNLTEILGSFCFRNS